MRRWLSLATSIVLFGILIGMSFFTAYWDFQKEKMVLDPRYNIEGLIQSSKSKETIPYPLLCKILDLYSDKPTNLYQADTEHLKEKLLNTPWIKEAHVEKVTPDMLFVEYTLREPIAILSDWKNRAIDNEGVLFPLHPVYTPKKLPSIYLGSINIPTALPFFSNLWEEIKEIKGGHLTLIDLSKIQDESLGSREIALIYEQWRERKSQERYLSRHILRLPVKQFSSAIKRYKTLRSFLYEEEYQHISSQNVATIVDLRIENLAFITCEEGRGRDH